jgi:hypothetical protein
MTDLKRMRLLCGLRQIDVWASTGIPLYRIAGAERGRVQLSKSEQTLLEGFLRERWESLQEIEMAIGAARSVQPHAMARTATG